MKRMFKRTLSLLLAAVMLFGASPIGALSEIDFPSLRDLFTVEAEAATYSGTCGDNLTWTLDTSTGVLTISGTGAMTDWSYGSYVRWYNYRSSIKSVTIGDSVTSIGNYAFEDCYSLTSVTIGNSVTSIGDYAFYSCDSLTSVTIPDSVTSIGEGAFRYCESLTSITIPDSVTSIGDYAFYSCDSLTSVTIGNSVTSIGDRAFFDCYSLTSVTIGNSVTSIGEDAFYDCDSLTSVTIPDSVTSIGDEAFCGCDSLTSVTIGNSVTSIGAVAFAYCASLKSIIVDKDNAYYSNDENGVLFNKDKTELVQYPEGIERTSYTIPDSVTSIGEHAFWSCDSLTSVTIPDSVTSIGDYAFYWCDSLTSVTIGNSVTSIGEHAFCNCRSLTSVTIPDSVTGIGEGAFCYCSGLTSVTIGNSVTSIGYSAFDGCDSLTDVYYSGTEEEWNKISIGSLNKALTNATIHYNFVSHEHSYEKAVTAPTCTKGGYTTYTCSCGDSYVADETTALGHSFGEWIETKAPTTQEEGEETHTCLRCGEAETRTVPKLQNTTNACFTVSNGKVHPGETVEITVDVANNPGIVAAKIALSFDNELLTLTEVRNGEVFSDSVMTKNKDMTKQPYTVLWSDALSEENNTNNGTLVTFVFTASKSAPECTVDINIDYDQSSTFDSDLNDVEFNVKGGEVEITNRVPGDPDCDGEVTLKDAVIIERYLADWDVTITDMRNADVDGDGVLTLKDSVLIKRYLADWDVELI